MVTLDVIGPLLRDGLPLVSVPVGQAVLSALIGAAAATTLARLAATPEQRAHT